METPLLSDVSDRLRRRLQQVQNWLIRKGFISPSNQGDQEQSLTVKKQNSLPSYKALILCHNVD